jgi:hypothetical protein
VERSAPKDSRYSNGRIRNRTFVDVHLPVAAFPARAVLTYRQALAAILLLLLALP